ncbi:MerR family transcriptional regulator [Cumulibacter manganitolerans]|uniref:MerR family transcriptional regulator n=1 Tax=Cumulibacter manganitolerans TaxID=1884992 RepID=UPI0012968489|nr:MerR family transcriptional regulator [Cumulibacter manganitolerans]
MLTIKAAAARLGISAATLRAWEGRYGVVTPTRSEGGYRLYDEADLRVLAEMARLVAAGWTPSLAASEARARVERLPDVDPPPGARAPRPELRAELLAAAAALDAERLAASLDEMFASGGHETVADTHVLPAMRALGEAWADGSVSVAGEHLASNAVMRRLAVGFEAAGAHETGPRVLVGLPPGARHEIGALSFAIAARRRGLSVDYLGADLPVADWVAAVAAREATAIVLAVPRAGDVPAAQQLVQAVQHAHPGTLVALGGAQQDVVGGATVPLGHEVGAASQALARLMAEQGGAAG